jgi:branched-chain amino acid transport system ATP-binding protein
MTGLYVPDGGGFIFAGAPLLADAPHQAAERGIARTFQNIRLFGNMTALENVMVGRHVRTRPASSAPCCATAARQRAEEAAIRQRAIELLHYVRIEERADDLAKNLSYGDQRRLEIARALATEPKLLVWTNRRPA